MLKIVLSLTSLAVCQGLYLHQPYPMFHSFSPLLVFREIPKPPVADVVLELPDEVEFVCPKDGTFPNLENACGSYFMCHGENVWEVNCQPGLLFDGSIGQCNWESAVRNTVKPISLSH